MQNIIDTAMPRTILSPQTVSSVATGDYISLKNTDKVAFLIETGTVTVGSKINIKEAKNVAGSSAQNLAFDYYYENAGAGSDTFTKTSADSSGACVTVANGDDSRQFVIEINASELSDSFDCLTLHVASSTANMVCAAQAIPLGARYQQSAMPTMLTD